MSDNSYREDIRQERALAALCGVSFDKSAFWHRNRPCQELLTEVRDQRLVVTPSFESAKAANRDDALRALLLDFIQRRLGVGRIADELTQRGIEKVLHKGKPWSKSGVHVLLRRLGLTSSGANPNPMQQRRQCPCGEPTRRAKGVYCSRACAHKADRIRRTRQPIISEAHGSDQ